MKKITDLQPGFKMYERIHYGKKPGSRETNRNSSNNPYSPEKRHRVISKKQKKLIDDYESWFNENS